MDLSCFFICFYYHVLLTSYVPYPSSLEAALTTSMTVAVDEYCIQGHIEGVLGVLQHPGPQVAESGKMCCVQPVSYTHLTLPTIYSV